MTRADDWSAIARAADPDEVRERILTGFRAGKPFTPYVPTIPLPSPTTRVLDFGCGLGRNFPYLTGIAQEVTGFDLPSMIDRCRELGPPVARLTSDWEEVGRHRFDLIFAALVLQHLDADLIRRYVADFATLAPRTYLLNRAIGDSGDNVFDLIGRTDAFDAGVCVEVDHDPETHRLRVLGQRTFDEVRASTHDAHYEVLLTSRSGPRLPLR